MAKVPQSPVAAPALARASVATSSGPAPSIVGTPTRASTNSARGIVRAHAPGSIPLSPVRLHVPLPISDTPSPLIPANDLPDDPQRASTAAHLYPLAPAWSPASFSPSIRSESGLTSDSMFFASPSLSRSHSVTRGRWPNTTQSRNRSRTQSSGHEYAHGTPTIGEADIFERSTERSSTHLYSPKEAIDLATAPALDHAADAIVRDANASLEVVTPQSPDNRLGHLSPWMGSSISLPRSDSSYQLPRSPGPRSPVPRKSMSRSPGPRSPAFRRMSDMPELSPAFLQAPNVRGHRRLASDISGTSKPLSPRANHSRGLSTTSAISGISDIISEAPRMVRTQSSSSTASITHNALSIDGAIIYDGEAARADHSIGGLADAIERLTTNERPPARSPSQHPANMSSYFALSPHLDDQPLHPHSPGSPSLFRYRVIPGEHGPASSGEVGTPRTVRSPGPAILLLLKSVALVSFMFRHHHMAIKNAFR
ncbi:hypothetical protein MCUN1_001990 [Malassezia cuniculi]|uniref:Uncharacterized protein n=1 Tax=Malassezia cuniculi TaxID=948313 RepID=A0AAF0EVN2_9BASI|nr:hypothetical protein MCUN1_001990 [Malassezia cuniculi]